MKVSPKVCSVLLAGWFVATPCTGAWGAIEFIGTGTIVGTAVDDLGLTDPIDVNGTPQNRLGGFGSAMAYTGIGNVYVATPDRGPNDGDSTYLDRFYYLNIDVNPVTKTVTPSLISTKLMFKGPGQVFTGNAGAFDASNSSASLRFDPEGVRLSAARNLFVSDEYGPFVYEFDQYGNRLRSLTIPSKFLIQPPGVPSADPSVELTNPSGRQSNRGMEGLAINPQGTKLYGMMQNALIQDHALDASAKRVGTNNRLLEIDTATGATREFLYQLSNKNYGVNEILAINDHEFLVLERDGKAGTEAKFKQIFKIDIAGASDISDVDELPQTGTPSGETPVSKSLFLDLLDPAYGLAGTDFPEKVEGLAFGPDLPDGRHLLLITSDNDFDADKATVIFAFAIDPADLPNFQAQVFVPAPPTAVLLGSGLLGLLGFRRKARR